MKTKIESGFDRLLNAAEHLAIVALAIVVMVKYVEYNKRIDRLEHYNHQLRVENQELEKRLFESKQKILPTFGRYEMSNDTIKH